MSLRFCVECGMVLNADQPEDEDECEMCYRHNHFPDDDERYELDFRTLEDMGSEFPDMTEEDYDA